MSSLSVPKMAPPAVRPQATALSIQAEQSYAPQSSTARRERSSNPSRRLRKREKSSRPAKPLSESQREELDTLARDIAAGHREFEQWLMATAARAIQIGQLGFQAKQIAGHGHFSAWKEHLRTQYGIAERSLERYMYLFKNRRKLHALIGSIGPAPDGIAETTKTGAPPSIKIQEALDFLERSAKPLAGKVSAPPTLATRAPQYSIPERVVAIARQLLGHLDFVVCDERFSAPDAVPVVVDPEDGDLTLPNRWRGRALVHCDEPQYSRVLAAVKQMHDHGPLKAALLLVPVVTDHPVMESFHACPRAFFRKRLDFGTAGHKPRAAQQPYMLVYLGPADRLADFHAATADEADVYVPFLN